jgi:hypothetical protein
MGSASAIHSVVFVVAVLVSGALFALAIYGCLKDKEVDNPS